VTRAAALAAAVAAVLAVGASHAAAPAAHDPPIVFVTATSATVSPDLAVRASNGRVARLTRNRWHEGLPTWSPDRRRIAFISARRGDADIFVAGADGRGVRILPGGARRGSDELYPAWSPDGRLIAFSSYRNGSGDVYVMRSDGTQVRRLTKAAAGIDNTQPVFSPDGRYVVYSRAARQLYRVRARDGGGLTRLTSSRYGNLMPDVSPDGTRIAFVSYRDGRSALWIADADGRSARRIVGYPTREVAFPRFSPDGKRLLYSVFRGGATVNDFRLRVIGVGGRGSRDIGAGAEADW
jgi:Tol biopolymer transport system component